MRNFLKYSSIKLRALKECCVPVGPGLNDFSPVEIDLLGAKLQLQAPRNKQAYREFENIEPSKHQNDLSGRPYTESVMPSTSWEFDVVLARNWGFYGPWFTGPVGALTFSVTGVSLVSHKAGVSFFHPRAFEVAVASYITAMYGHESDGGEAVWQGPVNWRSVSIGDVPAVRFDILPYSQPSNRMHFVFFPVSDEKLIQIKFTTHQYVSGSMDDRDRKVSPKPMNALIEGIVSSVSVELSQDACTQRARATEDLQSSAVSEDIPPLSWPFDVDSSGLAPRVNSESIEGLPLN